MKTNSLKRRQFLQKTGGALGVMSMGQALTFRSAEAAESMAEVEKKAKEELEKIMKEMEAQGKGYLAVPRKDGQFLNFLVKVARAQNVLEIGTSIGFSAIWMGAGLEETGGKLTTIEILEERVQKAKENVGKAGLTHRVNFKQGDAHQIVTTLEGSFDMIFLDADKEGQAEYFKKLHPNKLAPGGLLLCHNAIRSRDQMKEYLDLVSKHPDFDTVIISATMDDGFALSYRHKK
jgi:caffeoyl-CoA O-methyltransferase